MRTRPRWAAPAAVLACLVLVAALGVTVLRAGPAAGFRVSEAMLAVPESPGSDTTIGIDTSFFLPAADDGPMPAVLIAHGFGGNKAKTARQAEALAQEGYAVLTWSARGFGESKGQIALNDPDREVADVSRLIDWLAERPEVAQDRKGDPRVGVTGSSYGGAVTLLSAGYDDRIDAIAPQNTYNDLGDAFFPEATGAGAANGVFKQMWTSLMFTWGGFGDFSGLAEPGAQAPDEEAGETPEPGGEQGAENAPGEQQGSDQDPAEGAPLTPSQQQLAELADKLGVDPDDLADDPDALGKRIRCGFYREEICGLYERVAENQAPTDDIVELLHRNSPASVLDRVSAPTMLVHGKRDSLFTLDQADANIRGLQQNDVPVDVLWLEGGHDGGQYESGYIRERLTSWFDTWLKDEPPDGEPGFTVSRPDGPRGSAARSDEAPVKATAERYTGLTGTTQRDIKLSGGLQPVTAPPGGSPASVSSLPGLGRLTGLAELDGGGFAVDMPGQLATYESAPLAEPTQITGSPTAEVTVVGEGEAVLFAKLYDVDRSGQATLPQQLVAPLRIDATDAGTTAKVVLPPIDYRVEEGHTLRLAISTSDMSYATPDETATFNIALAGDQGVALPMRPELDAPGGAVPEWTWGLPLASVIVAAALLLVGRPRAGRGDPAPSPGGDPESDPPPLRIDGLTKRYPNGHLAVDDLAFEVRHGQVLGLLGPNGAGKTTTLRMLMGLVRPDSGQIRIFGRRVVPGTPALARLGSFVEGPGALPHLSGRANLDLYWQATGRPAAEARIDDAVRIADLGAALDRPVRTYSQGMRQRLAIAQAMLGLPDLLVLDEPTNGLDPPQIRAMRDVLVAYAAEGRTVVVSSHLLAEVEQTCTHVVVMDRGRKVAEGRVGELVGDGSAVLIGTPDPEATAELAAGIDGVAAAVADTDGVRVQLDGLGSGALVAQLVGLGVQVDRAVPLRRLEDAFLSLIGGGAERDPA
ncbi:alpha/beta fold hydrolase [Murinocardiopsis flavida]|uniref:alpha/beta fold hydrolase n=1 Tax=Murinocardiopsis flavida TaxID=645275 RepID=UPI001B80E37C|nr:alpha/beta fold hydrolase [Murinocardiopsis flavida]